MVGTSSYEMLRGDQGAARERDDPLDVPDLPAGARSATVATIAALGRLSRTVDREVIPRLMDAHDGGPQYPGDPSLAAADAVAIEPRDVVRFARALAAPQASDAGADLQDFRRQGASVPTLMLDLMAPAARMLGEDWIADRRGFAEVTLGLSRLQRLLRELTASHGRVPARPDSGRRILLATMPGEQHSFGVYMVEEFFRRAGWDVLLQAGTDADGLVKLVSTQPFCVIGLSLSRNDLIAPMQSVIDRLRQHSHNANVSIIVGGRVFAEDPELVPTAPRGTVAIASFKRKR
jgi:methanogenic corrinoid protein MtbC1